MSQQLKKNISIVLIFTIIARAISFFYEVYIASLIGSSESSDAFFMLSGLHAIIYPMLCIGTRSIFLPEYAKRLSVSPQKAANYFYAIAIFLFTLTAFATFNLIFFSKQVTYFVAPGFNETQKSLLSELIKISSWKYIFLTLSAIIASMLQCHNRYIGSQLREVLTLIPAIICAYLFYEEYGVNALAYGLACGGALRLFIQFPFIKKEYIISKLDYTNLKSDIFHFTRKIPSVFISTICVELQALSDRVIASFLPIGAVSHLYYGFKGVSIFTFIISNIITTSLYPTIAKTIASNDQTALYKILHNTLICLFFLLVPISLGCILYNYEIIELIFERGDFSVQTTYASSLTFFYYSFGILFFSTGSFLDSIFYCANDTVTPMRLNIFSLISNIILSIFLLNFIQESGVALATSITALLTCTMRLYNLKNIININYKLLIQEFFKIFISSLFSILTCYIINKFFLNVQNSFYKLLFTLAFSLPLYILLLIILKSSSLKIINCLKSK